MVASLAIQIIQKRGTTCIVYRKILIIVYSNTVQELTLVQSLDGLGFYQFISKLILTYKRRVGLAPRKELFYEKNTLRPSFYMNQ